MEELLTAKDLIFLNAHLIEHYGGGVEGVRYPDGLENAASRPFTSLFGEEQFPSDESKAASLLESIIRNHPFSDGNKRTAFGAGLTLYELLSEVEPKVDKDEAVRVCLGVENRSLNFTSLCEWSLSLRESES